jgi:hypothetical protein
VDAEAKWQLDRLVDLYKVHLDLYAKGIAIFLAIVSFAIKAALDDAQNRAVLAVVGLTATLLILIPAGFAAVYARTLRGEFERLARNRSRGQGRCGSKEGAAT